MSTPLLEDELAESQMSFGDHLEELRSRILKALLTLLLAGCFTQLRVRDEGVRLAVRYGPLPVFRKLIYYETIEIAEVARSSVIDGWGIQWVPGRGTTFNLWGFDCVLLHLKNGSKLRIGTDDPDGLAGFLQSRCREVAANRLAVEAEGF